MSGAQFRVWWIPQVPMTAFEFDVPSVEIGRLLCDALAKYDAFQFVHNIKPDYSNVGGVKWTHPIHTEDEWHDIDEDEDAEILLLATPRAPADEGAR